MADILDYVFLFWVFVTTAIYSIGSIYLQQVDSKNKADPKHKHGAREKPTPSSDPWSSHYSSSPTSGQRQDTNSSQFNAYQQSAYSSSNIGQQPLYSSQINNQAQSSSSNYHNEPQFNYQQQQQHSSQLNWPKRQSQLYQTSFDESSSHKSGARSYQEPTSDHQLTSEQNPERAWLQRNSSSGQTPASYHHSTDGDSKIPTASGFNSDCVEWVNSILFLFYSQAEKYGPIIMESVYRSLNEKLSNILSTSDEYGHLIIEFVGFNGQLSTKPELTNIRTESESEKSVSAVCKIYNKRIMLELSIQGARDGHSNLGSGPMDGLEPQEVRYELTLENLEGKLKSVAILNDKLIVVQFMEKPDTKISLRRKPGNTIAGMFSGSDGNHLIINEDSLVNLVLQTLTQIVVDLYFGDDADFPHYMKHSSSGGYRNRLNILKGSASEIKRQIKHDFFGAISSSTDKERKIFVKIIKAKNINYNQNVTCLLELDTPYQQALSSTKQGSNPYWEEHFLFNMNDKSNELTIELWDSVCLPKDTSGLGSLKRSAKLSTGLPSDSYQQQQQHQQETNKKWSKQEVIAGAKFLGSAKVNIDELRRNPVQKVNLMLQSRRPNNNTGENTNPMADLSNSVGGELQVELMFLEHSSSGSSGGGGGGGIKKSNSLSSIHPSYQQGDVVSVDRKLTSSGYVITTTTITKPNSKDRARQQSSSRLDKLSVRNQSPISSTEHSELDANLDGISSQMGDIRSASPNLELESGQQQNRQQPDGADRKPHRSRSRSRSFLRAIKKRFSLSRTRSRSVGESSPVPGRRGSQSALGTATLDAASIDSRSRASSEVSMAAGRAKSVPTSRDPSDVPTIVINKSRLSDTASAFTFTHPKSQLVIECKEPGQLSADGGNQQRSQLKYYAIPDELAHKNKWRRVGTKLHLFNEHQFIACHLSGSSTCHLCGRVFSRRPGKQGYKCRNCHLLSHKQCHVKVDHNCPYATSDGLKLEYIDEDPPTRLMELAQRGGADTLRQSSDSLPQHHNRPSKIGAKSISMDVDDR